MANLKSSVGVNIRRKEDGTMNTVITGDLCDEEEQRNNVRECGLRIFN
jgi:hypothetical protein